MPFWWMLVLGVVACAGSVWLIHFYQSLAGWTFVRRPRFILSFFYLPTIMFVESIMYWTIRRRISPGINAWTHIILFASAYVFSILTKALLIAYIYSGSFHMTTFLRLLNNVYPYVFWVMVIVAHVFFARVLMQAFAKPPGVDGPDSGNLLDDVLD
jgi:hypothetical protein